MQEDRTNVVRALTALALFATVLAGCTGWIEGSRTLKGYYSEDTPVPASRLLVETEQFLRNVAQTRQTHEAQIPEGRVRGVHLGPGPSGCERVALVQLEPARSSRDLRSTNYEVCPNRVSAVRADELAPSYPDSNDALLTLEQTRRAALLYGSQRSAYQGYTIVARRLGVPSAQPCRPIETMIVFDDMLVYHSLKDICQ